MSGNRRRGRCCPYQPFIVMLFLLGFALASPASAFALRSSGAGGWYAQDASRAGSNVNLTSVSFVDASHGWAVGGGDNEDATTRAAEDGDPAPLAATNGGATILATRNGGATWSAQDVGGPGNAADLASVGFVDASHGWAVGGSDSGGAAILATTNGGATWSRQDASDAGTNAYLVGVSFVDARHGWAAGESSSATTGASSPLVLDTSDGGATWAAEDVNSAGSDAQLTSVTFVDARHGWAVGDNLHDCVILATVDGGATWNTQDPGDTGTDAVLNSVCFVNPSDGWAVGDYYVSPGLTAPLILATHDGGATWSTQNVGVTVTDAFLSSVNFVDASHGWVVGERYNATTGASSPLVLVTSDGGATWASEDMSSAGSGADLNCVAFVDANHGWIVGDSHGASDLPTPVILATTTGGEPSATRADLISSLTSLQEALDAQYQRDINLTASTYVYTSEYRSEAKVTEPLALIVEKLREGLSVINTVLGAAGVNVDKLVSGKALSSPTTTHTLLSAMGKASGSPAARVTAATAGLSALFGDFKNASDYALFPQGYGKLSSAADALHKQYGSQNLDGAISAMEGEIENSSASPQVPLRAAAWTSGVRPKATSFALAPVQVDSAINRVFTKLIAAIPAQLPAGFDLTAVVARLKALRIEVASAGPRRVDFSGIAGLQGPKQTARRIPLGLIDGNWNCLSGLESAYIAHQSLEEKETVSGVVDGGLSVLGILTAGGSDVISNVASPVLLSYSVGAPVTIVPNLSLSPMDAMSENELQMSTYLVEELASLDEVANCASAYVSSTLSH